MRTDEMAMTEEQTEELRKLLVELKMLCSRTAVSLSKTSLLVESIGWVDALHTITTKIGAIEIPFEALATTSVVVHGEVPGSVDLTDLEDLRIPDNPSEFE